MNFKEDCHLCDNIKRGIKDGVICSLTNQKPNFNKTCPNIQLGDQFEKKTGLIHIKIESFKKKKILTYIYLSIYMVIGVLLIFSQGNFLAGFDLTYSKYLKLAGSLLVVIPGFMLIALALSILSKYRKKSKTIKEEKDRIDAVLNKYQIEYSCNVKFGKKYHGVQDVTVELKSNSDLLKNSKKTYQI